MGTKRAIIGLVLALLVSPSYGAGQQPLKVVASFSVLGDLVKNVGGDAIALTTLVGPDGDAHVYTPTPSDAKTVADAKLLFVNGLGLEGWLPRLVAASGRHAELVEATKGIMPRTAPSEGGTTEIDPHAWQSVANAKIYVANIRDALAAADPADAPVYATNASTYLERLDGLDREVRAAVATIPADRRKLVSTHDAFGYFAGAYGITFIAPQGVSTDTEPTAKDVAAIIIQVKTQHIPAVFLEKLGDPRLMARIASESGARLGGTLYSDSLSPPGGDAPTYIDMIRHNIRELTRALGGST